MYNNSLAMTSTLVEKRLKVKNICISLIAQSYPWLSASFLFLSTKIFEQNACRDRCIKLVQIEMTKYICQIRKLTHPHFIQKKFAEGEFLSLKSVMFLPW